MPHASIRRSIASAQLQAQFALEQGLPLRDCLEGTGITPHMLNDAQCEISASQELRLVENLVQGLGDRPGLGLDVGLRYHLSSYGIWGFALITSPTYGSAIEIALRYIDLTYAFVRFELQMDDRNAVFTLEDRHIPAPVRQYLLERDFAAWTNIVRELRPGGVALRALEFRGPAPTHAARFRALCGISPRFNAANHRAVHERAVMDAPLPQGDSRLARLCLAQCRDLLMQRQQREGVAARVRDQLLQSSRGLPDLNTVAAALHLAPRSLRRRLEQEGTSFRELLEEVRRTLAEELLSTGRIKLSEIAERLGYAEPASFIHAFKRWKAMSPTAYRRSLLTPSAVSDETPA